MSRANQANRSSNVDECVFCGLEIGTRVFAHGSLVVLGRAEISFRGEPRTMCSLCRKISERIRSKNRQTILAERVRRAYFPVKAGDGAMGTS